MSTKTMITLGFFSSFQDSQEAPALRVTDPIKRRRMKRISLKHLSLDHFMGFYLP